MPKKLGAVIFPLMLVVLASCAMFSGEAPTEDVDKAAALFFQRLDKADYNAIYNDAASQFKTNKTREVVTENLQQLTANGKVLEYVRTKMPLQGEGKNRMAMPTYGVAFETRNGDLTLTFQDEGGEWKLLAFAFKPRQ